MKPAPEEGTLYFYNNTVVSMRSRQTTLFRLSTNDEQVDCRNNIVYVTAPANMLTMVEDNGTLILKGPFMFSDLYI